MRKLQGQWFTIGDAIGQQNELQFLENVLATTQQELAGFNKIR